MRRPDNNKHVDVDVEIHDETELAIRVFDGDRLAWLAKSLLKDFDENSYNLIPTPAMTITMPEWLAKQKGLI